MGQKTSIHDQTKTTAPTKPPVSNVDSANRAASEFEYDETYGFAVRIPNKRAWRKLAHKPLDKTFARCEVVKAIIHILEPNKRDGSDVRVYYLDSVRYSERECFLFFCNFVCNVHMMQVAFSLGICSRCIEAPFRNGVERFQCEAVHIRRPRFCARHNHAIQGSSTAFLWADG